MMNEEDNDKIKYETNHQLLDVDETLFSSIHHHNRLNHLYSTEQHTYSTSSSLINSNNKLNDFTRNDFTSKLNGYLPSSTTSKSSKFLVIDCTSDSSKITNFNYQTDSTIHHSNLPQTTFQFELWRENEEQNLLLVNKRAIQRPRFLISYSIFDEWLVDQEFVYSIYLQAYNNQGKSDHLLKITFNQPDQLLERQQEHLKKQLFKLIPYSVFSNDQNSTHNQSKLFKSSNFSRPFTLLSAGSLYKGERDFAFFTLEIYLYI